ncbi:hypothetical protein Tco_1521140, partial [Tanacetum coccineum]
RNMLEYQDAFDTPLSMVDVSEEHVVSFYLGGLPTEIEMGVRMFRPKTLADAYQLTNLQEATFEAIKKKNKAVLTSQNERFGGGRHKCSGQLFSIVLLADEELECEEEYMEEVSSMPDEVPQVSQVSLNALNDANSFQTTRIIGNIDKHEVHILVDCWATHNFLDVNVAKQVGCKTKSTYPLAVTIGGGGKLINDVVCKNFKWQL